MLHLVRKRWNQLKEGDFIKLKGDRREWELVEKTGGAHFIVEYPLDEIDDNGFATESKVVEFSKDYEGSWVESQDCVEGVIEYRKQVETIDPCVDYRHGWSDAERYYGIGHLGSGQTDPLKQLALAILRGDPQACDAARDILKC